MKSFKGWLAAIAVLATTVGACSSESTPGSTGAAGSDANATAGSGATAGKGGAGGVGADPCFLPAGHTHPPVAAGTDCGPVDTRCPKNTAVAIAQVADRSLCQAGGYELTFGSCGSGYVLSPTFGAIGHGELDCYYGSDGAPVGSLACDNGPGDTQGDCHLGGVVGSGSVGCTSNHAIAGCSGGGTGAGGTGGGAPALDVACPANFTMAQAAACPATGAVTLALETCGAQRAWARFSGTDSVACAYASDGTLAGSETCQSGSCTFAGARIDDGACSAVTFKSCGGRL
jgi:hypothetical protein